MKKLLIAACVASAAAGLLAACNNDNKSSSDTTPKSATVRLIAFNDFHGYIDPPAPVKVADPNDSTKTVSESTGGAAYLATMVAQLKAENPLNAVIGAGDMVGASPLDSALFHDEPTIQALNNIGLEFTSVGNHEFDKGVTELQRKQTGGCFPGGTAGQDTCVINNSFEGAKFKYLAANVIDNSTGKPIFPAYAIKQFDIGNGKQLGIAFVGLVLKETPSLVTASGVANVTFKDEADTVNALLPEIRAQGVNAVVVLIHQGIYTTAFNDTQSCAGANGELLSILPKLDPTIKLVISAHTHWPYICNDGQGTSGATSVFYTSAYRYGSFVTALDVTLDSASDTITNVAAANHLVVNDKAANPAPVAYPTLSANATVAGIVAQYDSASAALVNKVVGSISADITTDGEAISSGTSGESPLGDLIADSQLVAAQADPKPAVIAFMNPGGIRTNLLFNQISGGEQPGQITYGEAYNVQPFGDILTDLDLTGAQIYTILGQQWVGQTSPKILEVSKGFTYTWDASLPDGSSKIVDGSVALNGTPIDKSKTYRVEANNFIAGGGDGFTGFTTGTNLYTGAVDIDAFAQYITANSNGAPLMPITPSRITRLH